MNLDYDKLLKEALIAHEQRYKELATLKKRWVFYDEFNKEIDAKVNATLLNMLVSNITSRKP